MSVNDCLVWYLRASSPEEKQRWVDVLKSYKVIILNIVIHIYFILFIYSFIIIKIYTTLNITNKLNKYRILITTERKVINTKIVKR